MVSDCPLACKHLNEFLNEDKDSNYISMHPIEVVAQAYNLSWFYKVRYYINLYDYRK